MIPQITVSQNEVEIDFIDNIKMNLKFDQYLGKYFPFCRRGIKVQKYHKSSSLNIENTHSFMHPAIYLLHVPRLCPRIEDMVVTQKVLVLTALLFT